MPIVSIQDAQEVEHSFQTILSAPEINARLQAIRTLFVETLDFDLADQQISLNSAGNDQLPDEAHIVARRDGVSLVYIPLDNAGNDRVTGAVASAAAKTVGNVLDDDLLLLFTNRDRNQLHIVNPDLTGSRPRLQRIVAYKDQLQYTVVQQIANMWDNYGNRGKTIREAIEIAFSVEPVTKQFFETYHMIFKNAEEQITGFEDDEQKHRFTQTLFNRLMFVYFLSRKGWLKFKGNTDYLNAVWQDHNSIPDQGNFYTSRIKPLFFSGLNNPDSRDLTQGLATLIGDVPFLNGGLFEETDLDKREEANVPDKVIEQILTDLFDHFNFTVMESTPYDVEVAVDPEMLGKVFEELVTGRHDSGAYYTPRSVVSFMCREALKGYLEGKETGLDATAIARFVDEHDTSGISLVGAPRVSEALSEVTVVDPACGSGAYLLGMMQELIELQTILYNIGVDAKKIYDLKLEIIQRNLYGVDIDEFAVNIAMLRMWLSLAIDYEGDKPEPLPNLDFKVVCGDSLLGPDPSAGVEVQGALGQDTEQFQRLGQLKADYMRASLGTDKDRLKSAIQETEADIREALGNVGVIKGAVDWRVEFAEVFAERQGFDVAIANPPYIQLQGNGGRLGKLYRDAGYQTFAPTGDIYQLFYERGCQILKSYAGLLTYITSNSWLKAEYGKSTRNYFASRHTPLLLLELGKDVFESAIVDSGVLVLSTGGASHPFRSVDLDRLSNKEIPPAQGLWGLTRPEGDEPWSILSPLGQSVMDKMQVKGTPLKDWDVSINYGIKTGYNNAFIIDNSVKEALIAADPNSADIIKPVLRGRDIQRYRAQWDGKWLICTFPSVKLDIDDYPAVENYLLTFGKNRLEQSGKTLANGNKARKKTQHSWYELQDSISYHEQFTKEKLIWIELVENGRFAYDDSGIYGEVTTFIMTGSSLKYICAVLNTSLIRWFLQQMAPTSGMGTFRWKKVYVENIPIPKITAAEQEPFIKLVDQILKAKDAEPDADTNDLEWEIDRLVYDLFGLTEEEDTTIERSLRLIHASDEEEDAEFLKMLIEADTGDLVSEETVKATLLALDGS